MPDPTPILIVRDGKMLPGSRLEAGDRIASKVYEAEHGCLVVYLAVDGVPPSSEVEQAGQWDCDERGHRFVPGNGCCLECGDTYAC